MTKDNCIDFQKSQVIKPELHFDHYAPDSHFYPLHLYSDGDVYTANGNYVGIGEVVDGKLKITNCHVK